MQDYVRKRQGNLLSLSGIIKGGGFILVVWKSKQIYNKILLGLIYLSFSSLFADHWVMKRAMRNVCLETTFSPT